MGAPGAVCRGVRCQRRPALPHTTAAGATSARPTYRSPSRTCCRGYLSPPDISMDMTRLRQDMPGIQLTPLVVMLKQLFPANGRR